jgi:hypothetical protein
MDCGKPAGTPDQADVILECLKKPYFFQLSRIGTRGGLIVGELYRADHNGNYKKVSSSTCFPERHLIMGMPAPHSEDGMR